MVWQSDSGWCEEVLVDMPVDTHCPPRASTRQEVLLHSCIGCSWTRWDLSVKNRVERSWRRETELRRDKELSREMELPCRMGITRPLVLDATAPS
jgi:hypothetical protein